MTVAEGPHAVGLVARVQNILARPSAEWDVIAVEPATIGGLYSGYACILAAIPAVASVLGWVVRGHFFVVGAVLVAVVSYVLSLVGVFVVAWIIDALAPSFSAEKNQVQAMKLVTYSYTAAWVAGAFDILPVLGGLMTLLGGIYSLYLLYLGLPKLMKNPPDRSPAYLLVTIGAAIVIYLVAAVVVEMVTAMFAIGAFATGAALSVR